MKKSIIAHQVFDSTNTTILRFATIGDAFAWIKDQIAAFPNATYSIFRASTSNRIARWEAGHWYTYGIRPSDLRRMRTGDACRIHIYSNKSGKQIDHYDGADTEECEMLASQKYSNNDFDGYHWSGIDVPVSNAI